MEASDRLSYTDLVQVDNTFNRATFEAKKIYFLKPQKLSKNSLLVRVTSRKKTLKMVKCFLRSVLICIHSRSGHDPKHHETLI